jgi:hypothetical protein
MYWLSDYLPLANSMGFLSSKTLVQAGVKAGMPFISLLPKVPPRKRARKKKLEEIEDDHNGQLRITLPKSKLTDDGTVYYVLEINKKYSGEFRYSALRKLHDKVQENLSIFAEKDIQIPSFPPKSARKLDFGQIEDRRILLEEYLQVVLAEKTIVKAIDLESFLYEHKQWDETMPTNDTSSAIG